MASAALTRAQKMRGEEPQIKIEGEGKGEVPSEDSKMDSGFGESEEEDWDMTTEEEEDDEEMKDFDHEEPKFLYFHGPDTRWGQAYFEALAQDHEYINPREPYYTSEDLFILKRTPGGGPSRCYIPDGIVPIGGKTYSMRELMIAATHHRLQHFGLHKTYEALRRETIWPNQYWDVLTFIRHCDSCQRNKQPTQKPPGKTYMLEVPDRPWQSIAIDFLGPLTTSNGEKNVMVIVDRFSTSVVLVSLPAKYTAASVAEHLIRNVYTRYGLPRDIVSDRDTRFVSHYWRAMHDHFGIELYQTTAFHQQSNGTAEKAVKTTAQILRTYSNARQNNWTDNLWRAEYAMNNAPTEWNGKTPLEICYGEVRTLPTGIAATKTEAVNNYLEHQRVNNLIAQDALENFRYKQGQYSSQRRNASRAFSVGDLVMYKRRTYEKGKVHKLFSIWRGPYRITQISARGNCTLKLPKGDRRHPVFATDSLKLYYNNPESQRGMAKDEPDGEEPLYEIERLINHRKIGNKEEYLVRWLGYDEDEDTWEPRSSLEETAMDAITEYHRYE